MNRFKAILLGVMLATVIPSADGADVAIVVNKENPVENFSLKQLTAVFEMTSKDWKNWKGHKKIYLVLMESGEMEHDVMLKKVYRKSDTALTKFWKRLRFTQNGDPPKKRWKSSREVKIIVSRNLQTIGYINAEEADDSVKVIRIDGLLPGEEGYPLKRD